MAKQGKEKCQIAGSKLLGCLWLLLVAEWLPTLRRRGMGSREAQVEQRHCLRVNELCKQFLITCLFGSHSISYFPGRVEWGSAGQALRQGVRGVGGRGYHSKQQAANRRAALEQQSSTVAQQPIEADFKLNWINRSPRTRSAGNEVLPRPPDHVTVGQELKSALKRLTVSFSVANRIECTLTDPDTKCWLNWTFIQYVDRKALMKLFDRRGTFILSNIYRTAAKD